MIIKLLISIENDPMTHRHKDNRCRGAHHCVAVQLQTDNHESSPPSSRRLTLASE